MEILVVLVAVAVVGAAVVWVAKGSHALHGASFKPLNPDIRALVERIESGVEHGVISEGEENAILAEVKRLVDGGVSENEIRRLPAWTHLVQACVIRELTDGVIPDRFDMQSVPYNLKRGERLIWSFSNVTRYELTHVRTRHGGGSLGLSIRIAKGVYLRPSAFSAESKSEVRSVAVGQGDLGITDMHVYFHDYGMGRSFRTPYSKVVSFKPYKDGLAYSPEAVTAKTQLMKFASDDGWFAYNLVQNLAGMHE